MTQDDANAYRATIRAIKDAAIPDDEWQRLTDHVLERARAVGNAMGVKTAGNAEKRLYDDAKQSRGRMDTGISGHDGIEGQSVETPVNTPLEGVARRA
jgi:hypothetical protein